MIMIKLNFNNLTASNNVKNYINFNSLVNWIHQNEKGPTPLFLYGELGMGPFHFQVFNY